MATGLWGRLPGSPLWVILTVPAAGCLPYSRKLTSMAASSMSVLGQQPTHAPRQVAPYRSVCRCGRARLIRATPLCENPRSSAPRLLIAGSERSTPIL